MILQKKIIIGPNMADIDRIPVPELMNLCREGNFTRIKNCFEKNPEDFHVLDESGRLPIHWAVSGGHLEVAQFLATQLKGTESIEGEDDMGWTPLMIASSAGHKNLVKFLLDSGANVSVTNHNGQTCLHYAASKDHGEIAMMLLEKGALVNAQDKVGSSPLHRAASKGNIKMVNLLMSSHSCHVNIADRMGNTPLHLACDERRTDVAVTLVKGGAHLDRLNKEEQSPLDLAEPGLRRTLQRLAETG